MLSPPVVHEKRVSIQGSARQRAVNCAPDPDPEKAVEARNIKLESKEPPTKGFPALHISPRPRPRRRRPTYSCHQDRLQHQLYVLACLGYPGFIALVCGEARATQCVGRPRDYGTQLWGFAI